MMKRPGLTRHGSRGAFAAALVLGALFYAPSITRADEGGVSFWVPGFFGSLAATPLQPGWMVQTIYYHTSVSAGADVALAREFELKRIPVGLSASLSANLSATGDLGLVFPTYTFASPVLGGQATVGFVAAYGRVSTSLAGTLSGALTTPFGTLPFFRSDSISDSVWGFGDLLPLASLRWNNGVNNWMMYVTGDVPVGAYDSNRLSNIGIGHGAFDAGAGYTYFDPTRGHEFSAVLGFTANFLNNRRNIRTASTCTSIGAHRSSSPSRSWPAWSVMCTKRSVATAAPAIGSAASNRKWSASAHRSDSFSRSAICKAIST